ncbi:MAG: hypothetical protein QM784_01410 [Polyangiaceae bacterium]
MSILAGTDGVGPAIMPVVAFDVLARGSFDVRSEFAGFGSRPSVSSEVGSASVAQHYGTLGLGYRFLPDAMVGPRVALSVGVLRTAVHGNAEPTEKERHDTQWSVLLDGSAGATLRLSRRYYLTLAAHVQFAEPYVAIHLLDATVATTGRPNVALTTTLGAWP